MAFVPFVSEEFSVWDGNSGGEDDVLVLLDDEVFIEAFPDGVGLAVPRGFACADLNEVALNAGEVGPTEPRLDVETEVSLELTTEPMLGRLLEDIKLDWPTGDVVHGVFEDIGDASDDDDDDEFEYALGRVLSSKVSPRVLLTFIISATQSDSCMGI